MSAASTDDEAVRSLPGNNDVVNDCDRESPGDEPVGNGGCTGSDQELASLKAQYALTEELHASKLRDLASANNELKDRVASVLADLATRSKELDESRRVHTQQCQDAETRHGQLSSDLEQVRSSLGVKELAAEEARNELEVERSRFQEHLVEMRKDSERRSSEHELALSSAQSDLRSQLEKAERRNEDIEKDLLSLQGQVAEKEEERLSAVSEKSKADRLTQQFRQDAEKSKAEAKSLQTEVCKWQTNYESVQTLLNDTQKQSDKGKDDIKSQFIKLSWAQNKLKAESEAHKETKTKLESTSKRLDTVQQEMDKLRKDYNKTVADVQDQSVRSSTQLDSRIKDLEVDVKRKNEEIKVERQAHKVTAQQLLDAQAELKLVAEGLSSAQAKGEEQSKQVEELQLNVSKEHDRFEETQRQCDRLNSRIGEIGELRQQLSQERERVATLSAELGEVLTSRSELEGEVGERQQREGEMLSFHQRMASLNAELQSQHTKLSDDVISLRTGNSDLLVERNRFEEERDRLQRELESLKQQYRTEVSRLSGKVDDKTKAVEQLTVLLEDERGEVRVLKRKNAASVKDLTRQLLQTRKTVDALKNGDLDLDEFRQQVPSSSGGGGSGRNSIPRCGSDADLSHSPVSYNTEVIVGSPEEATMRTNSVPPQGSSHVRHLSSHVRHLSPAGNGSAARARSLSVGRHASDERVHAVDSARHMPRHKSPVDDDGLHSVSIARPPAAIEKERRMLLNKIGSLQNSHASKDEKMEFMDSHISELTEEIRRKTRVIQTLVLRQDSGSISPASLDTYKLQAGPQRGIMASVFQSRKVDQKMTLSLSLQITTKMQAVLEDLLIKNMTLKDNLSTLGQEVADLLAVIKHHNIRIPRKF